MQIEVPFISFAIPVCNEHNELNRLLSFLIANKQAVDEIVVQCDKGNTTQEVYRVLGKYTGSIKVIEYPLNGNFGAFKNNLKANCTGAWIVQLDADELLHEEFVQSLPQILKDNPYVELFCLPRVNTVTGLTDAHIQKWGWKVDDKGWVNYPDLQTRILQNIPRIAWAGKVHEVITGHSTTALMPLEEVYSIIHHKDIRRQEIQNTHYSLL